MQGTWHGLSCQFDDHSGPRWNARKQSGVAVAAIVQWLAGVAWEQAVQGLVRLLGVAILVTPVKLDLSA